MGIVYAPGTIQPKIIFLPGSGSVGACFLFLAWGPRAGSVMLSGAVVKEALLKMNSAAPALQKRNLKVFMRCNLLFKNLHALVHKLVK